MVDYPALKGAQVKNYIFVEELPQAKIKVYCYTKIRPGTAKMRGLATRVFDADRRNGLVLRFAAAGYEIFPKYLRAQSRIKAIKPKNFILPKS